MAESVARNIFDERVEKPREIKVETDFDAMLAKPLAPVEREKKSVTQTKPHHRSVEHLVESGVPLCGDFGGVMQNGKPCTRDAGYGFPDRHGDGKCYLHDDVVLDDMTAKKRKLIEIYSNQPMTMRAACEAVGVNSVTVLRWRKADAEFDKEMKTLIEVATEARVQMIEDSSTLRAIDPTNSADGLRMYLLQNWAPHRFKDQRRVEVTGADGGPIQSANVNYNVRWDIGEENPHFFFAETPPREIEDHGTAREATRAGRDLDASDE